jgi:putative membrane protein
MGNRSMKLMHVVFAAAATLVTAGVYAQGAGPTDPQIAAIVVVANQVDIDASKLAESKGQKQEVKDFAKLMVANHTEVNQAAKDLVTKLHVTPEPNATSKSLQEGGDKNLASLKKLSGAAFDKAYIDHEVAYHQAVLDAVDKTLIPSAQNAQLKALLEQARPTFVTHLAHAKQVQGMLSK